ncbi:hypothetical protein DYE49_03620 [Treponema rectale]|uniref:Uncharacterized protein n=1 Tax=Treponema rectale TaxID=744512 RepID=A0A7M1XIX9_9SPIR|nr:hypothetical protein DYE49_03620 [Treponema rectale]
MCQSVFYGFDYRHWSFLCKYSTKIKLFSEIQDAFYFLLKFVVTKDIFYYHCVYKTPGHLPGHFDFNKAYDKIELQKG